MAYLHAQKEHQKTQTGPGANVIAHEAKERDIAVLAYEFWQGRCCPEGLPQEDWFRAAEELRSRH
jgi:nucleoside phosphorylase